MNRREFMRGIGMGAAALALSETAPAATGNQKKPNILFIMVDDYGSQWTGAYGGEEAETPNVDALAKGGMLFKNAYSMPQCTPTRVTLLTGQYPWRHGWINHWDVPRWGVGYFDWERNASFATVMKGAGYATCVAGKWQINDFRLHPDALAKCGFDDYCVWTGAEGSLDKAHTNLSLQRYWDPYLHTKEGSREYKGEYGPDKVTDFLVDFMKKNKDQPMMLYYPMILTHGPHVKTPLNLNVKDKREAYAENVRYTDFLLGKLVKAIDGLGIRDNTIIIWATDNGGGPNTIRNGETVGGGKGTTRETGVNTPFIVNCPGLVPAGVKTDALTDFTDLLPTFAELGGAQLPDSVVDGHSIAPLILGKAKDSTREWIMAMGGGGATVDENGRVAPVHEYRDRVIRDKRYKLWVGLDRTSIRFHDLQKDPLEKNNLIDSAEPKIIAARKKLEAVVRTWPKKDPAPRYRRIPIEPWNRTASKKK